MERGKNSVAFSPSAISRPRPKFTKRRAHYRVVWAYVVFGVLSTSQCQIRPSGQTQPVIIHHLVTKGTIDEQVIKALQAKEQGQSALMAAVKAKIEEYRR